MFRRLPGSGCEVVWQSRLEKPAGCGFHEKFLELPAEVLLTSMETHQKSFGLRGADGKLLPYFLTAANIESREPALVRKGWERVLRARLSNEFG